MRVGPKNLINPGYLDFKGSFLLNRGNIGNFVNCYSNYIGKFVFHKGLNKLAMAEDLLHRHIARSIIGAIEVSKENMIGGYITYKKDKNEILFELDGDSGYFGRPSEEDLQIAAEFVGELLKSIGYLPKIEKDTGSFFKIKGEFA